MVAAPGLTAERKWFFDQENHLITTQIGDRRNIIGTFGAPRPNQYLKVGVENMMREDAKHRWRIEYCDTGKQEPDNYGVTQANNVAAAAARPLPWDNPTGFTGYVEG